MSQCYRWHTTLEDWFGRFHTVAEAQCYSQPSLAKQLLQQLFIVYSHSVNDDGNVTIADESDSFTHMLL